MYRRVFPVEPEHEEFAVGRAELFNVGRNLTINALWDVPAPQAFSGPAGWIARGWQLGGILQASSGVPLWPLDGVEGDPMGQLNSEPIAIPDRVGGCQLTLPSSGRHGSLQYINPACLINAQAPSAGFYSANCDRVLLLPLASTFWEISGATPLLDQAW